MAESALLRNRGLRNGNSVTVATNAHAPMNIIMAKALVDLFNPVLNVPENSSTSCPTVCESWKHKLTTNLCTAVLTHHCVYVAISPPIRIFMHVYYFCVIWPICKQRKALHHAKILAMRYNILVLHSTFLPACLHWQVCPRNQVEWLFAGGVTICSCHRDWAI